MTDEVLVLDDDATMLTFLTEVLTGAGFTCLQTTQPAEALALIREKPEISVVLSDIFMPEISGFQFVDRLNALSLGRPAPRVLLLTAHPSLEIAVDALRLGVRDFLVKPVRAPELIEATERALSQARMDRAAWPTRSPQVERLVRHAEELVGRIRNLAYTSEELDEESTAEIPIPDAASQGPVSLSEPSRETAAPAGKRKVARSGAGGAAASADGGRLTVLNIIKQLRRLRSNYEQHKLDDVAWDLLLELLRAERMRQRLSVSGLAISIDGVSATTSLRRMNELESRGYIERVPDASDARRDFVVLTPKAQELLAEYLAEANDYVTRLTT
ncbi:MAG TPA: response regulator [Steroidobacteraceae bacterium]